MPRRTQSYISKIKRKGMRKCGPHAPVYNGWKPSQVKENPSIIRSFDQIFRGSAPNERGSMVPGEEEEEEERFLGNEKRDLKRVRWHAETGA
ncbi:hypothetical protein RUM44_008081 [Polyplax serrata]|uniref:Uncharacterized protein n=1 Tax=Polyplax serrata TaxID=468196 RepID=A0ABR1B952_POLSC